MAQAAVTLNDLELHLPIARLFESNSSAICAAIYKISTYSVLARSRCVILRFLCYHPIWCGSCRPISPTICLSV